MDDLPSTSPNLEPEIKFVPPATSKFSFKWSTLLPILVMAAALPLLVKSIRTRLLTGSRASYPSSYCTETYGCPVPTPCPDSYGCPSESITPTNSPEISQIPTIHPSPILTPAPPARFGRAAFLPNDPSNIGYISAKPDLNLVLNPALTVEAWVNVLRPASGTYLREFHILTLTKPQTINDYGYLFDLTAEVQEKTGEWRPLYKQLLKGGSVIFNSAYANVGATSGLTFSPNRWYHLAVTAQTTPNNCQLFMFVDGKLLAQSTVGGPGCSFSTETPDQLYIGRGSSLSTGISGHYFAGTLDEIRLSNNVLYANGFVPQTSAFVPSASTLSLYHLDGDATDATGRSNGTVVGQISFVPSVATPTIQQPTPTRTPSVVPSRMPTPTPTPAARNITINTLFLWPAIGLTNRTYTATIGATGAYPGDILTMTTANNAGLKINSCVQAITRTSLSTINCKLTGTPKQAGSFPITITVRNQRGNVSAKTYVLRVLNLTIFFPPVRPGGPS